MKKTIISMSLVCVMMSGLVGLLSYHAGCNNTYEKDMIDTDERISNYVNVIDEYNCELVELRAKIDDMSAELTNMYNGEAFEFQWEYDDKLYSYEDNGKLFGVTKTMAY